MRTAAPIELNSEQRAALERIARQRSLPARLVERARIVLRALSWHACRSFDTAAPGALELAIHAKVFGSEAAVRVITDLMRVVGVESYGHELPLAGLLQDTVALPLFAGGNIGVRRRQLHALILDPAYDDLATLDRLCLAETAFSGERGTA